MFTLLQDQYECIDLSDNEIQHLHNFARLGRLRTLILNNNAVSRISPEMGEQLPGLETLILTNNRISSLSAIDALASCKRLGE